MTTTQGPRRAVDRRDPAPGRPSPNPAGTDVPVGLLQRILPTSILGLASLLFFMAIAAAFSGAVLFAYYQFELEDERDRITRVETAVADDLEAAKQALAVERDNALNQIDDQLAELERFAASGATMEDLLAQVQASVFFVSTLDENGQPSVGSAFVLFSDSEQSFLLTSYTTIRAATRSPGPAVSVKKGDQEIPIELRTWDEARDVALLIADVPNLPEIPRGSLTNLSVGDRIFAVSGLGAAGGSIVQGVVADTAGNALQHDAQIGAQFQGGPLLNSKGELIAVASRSYAPVAFDPKAVFFGVPWQESCVKVVQCPG